jgi:hypothetical protein
MVHLSINKDIVFSSYIYQALSVIFRSNSKSGTLGLVTQTGGA